MPVHDAGLAVDGTFGVEMNRTGTRFLIEANTSLPLYESRGYYPAAFVATVGMGI